MECYKIELRMNSGNKILLKSKEYPAYLINMFLDKESHVSDVDNVRVKKGETLEPWGDVWDEVIFNIYQIESISITKRSKTI